MNDVVALGDKLYGAIYSSGALVELDPAKPWDNAPLSESSNPKVLYETNLGAETFGRPRAMAADPERNRVFLGGHPARGSAGGGLLIYDAAKEEAKVLGPGELFDDQSIQTLVALETEGLLAGGTWRRGARAGAPKLFLLDPGSGQLLNTITLEESVRGVLDLIEVAPGRLLGVAQAETPIVFLWDTDQGEIRKQESLSQYGHPAGSQAPRILARDPQGRVVALFQRAVVRIDPESLETELVAPLRSQAGTGLTPHGDTLYFSGGSHLYSLPLGPESSP